ncbi:MAG: endonuclease/exonuclease/phosphatase family protein [Prolixibacteraceae bacterium]
MKVLTKDSVFLIVLIFLTGLFHASEGQSKNDKAFNIVTYNIRMNTPSDGENAWPLRKDKVAALLRFHQADIFNVQEALAEQMDDLKKSFPDFDFVGVGRDDGKAAGEFMAIFFRKDRFERLTDGMFWLNEHPDKPGLGWDAPSDIRDVTWIKLKDKQGGTIFYVLNTHFDHRGVVAREESAKLIVKFVREENAEKLPLILTGDFNCVKNSVPVQLIMEELSDAQDKSLTPPYGPEGTAGGFNVKVVTKKIDFIFVNDPVSVLRHGVLSDSYGLFYPSDHLPVLTEVQLQ